MRIYAYFKYKKSMNSFPEVFTELNMDITDRELMKTAEVLKVTASADKSSLTVLIKNHEDIPRVTMHAAEDAIRTKIFHKKNIRVEIVQLDYGLDDRGRGSYSSGGTRAGSGGGYGSGAGYGAVSGSGGGYVSGMGYGSGTGSGKAAGPVQDSDRTDGGMASAYVSGSDPAAAAAPGSAGSGLLPSSARGTGSMSGGTGSWNGTGSQTQVQNRKKPGQSGFKVAKNQWTPRMDKKSDNPDVIYGYDFSGEPVRISMIEEGMGAVIVEGKVFGLEVKTTKTEKFIFEFYITDGTDSITAKIFLDENSKNEIEGKLKDGIFVAISGSVESPNQFSPELTIGRIKAIKLIKDPTSAREDRHPGEKRIELNLHTKMSDMDGIGDIGQYIELASKWGWKAIGITDNNSVQVFPTAAHSLPKGSDLKLIYGVTGNLVVDDRDAVTFPACYDPDRESEHDFASYSLDGEFVVFDIETTGFSMINDRIIEIGAVKINNGVITDRYSEFIDPEMPIPARITELTTITDDQVRGAGNYEKHIPEFLRFIGEDTPVVGHNAHFDVGFIKRNAERLGLKFDPPIIDTLGLSHMLLKNLFRNKLDNIAKELNVTLSTHHRAVADAEATAGIFMAFVKMLRAKGITDLGSLYEADEMDAETIKKLHPSPFSMIALNDLGRTNMYRLVSAAHIDYLYNEPRMPKSLVGKLREGLLIGSGNEDGDFYDKVIRGVPDDELIADASFYDYFELMPPSNIAWLINDPMSPVGSMEDIREISRRIAELGERLGKPVIATGNTHFANRGESIYRKIIKYFEFSSKGRKFNEEKYSAELFLRTTDEMLEEFTFLGAEKAEEIVIKNPSRIADMCEPIAPVRPDKCPPVIENSDNELKESCYQKARELYGDEIPEIVKTRLDKELNSIITNGYSVMYIIARRLVMDSEEHGYLVGSRGSVGSSLAATFGGISEVNPLPPHYRCPKCHYSDFDSDIVKQYKTRAGYDLPDMNCPNCGEPLVKDGFDIPFETFLGFKGDKEPDIDLNFAGEYQPKAHAYTEVLFGKGQTYKAGTIGTVQDKTAYGYVLRYNEDHEKAGNTDMDAPVKHMRKAEIMRLAMGCTEVRRATGQHPGGIVVLPHGEEISTFTPIQYPANDSSNMVTTHFDYHSIDHNLLKLDILGKDDPSMVRMLQDLTGLDPMDIPIGTPEIMSLFTSTESLGIKPEDIEGTPCGTMGVPEFGTDFAMQMLLEANPKYVSDLVRIAGLAHGTDVWIGNAQKLISEGTCTIDTAICTRDDIMIYLISMGVDPAQSFKIMELVRKGKFKKDANHDKFCDVMREHGVPEWYIWSCDTIKYMFPKAHAAAYVVMSWRIAYYKVHFPLAYYAAYFTVKGKGFDYEKMCVPLSKLKNTIAELRERMAATRDPSANDKLALRDIRIVEEMMARGLEFAPIDIFKAKADRFTITPEGKIMPSLDSISGLGTNAALAIERDAVNGSYLSMEEFISRTHVSKTNAALLKSLGLLGSIPESNQLSLFDMMM